VDLPARFLARLLECGLLGEWALRWDEPGAGRQFAALMEGRREGELEKEFRPLRRGWCLGSKQFRASMLKYIEGQKGKWHYGTELRESAEAKAEPLIAEAGRTKGITAEQIRQWRKGHPAKVKLALKLRAQTTCRSAGLLSGCRWAPGRTWRSCSAAPKLPPPPRNNRAWLSEPMQEHTLSLTDTFSFFQLPSGHRASSWRASNCR
jgi:hypothetical protein